MPSYHGTLTLPPAALRFRVAGTDNEEWFLTSGKASARDLERGLAAVGQRLVDFPRVLEWGCGCGRILQHIALLAPEIELHGHDIDDDAIEWVREHMPTVHCTVTGGLPPLGYADASFDLVYNHSVMTHLDESYQDAWLQELRRVIRPGGVLTLSFAGNFAFDDYLSKHVHGHAEQEWLARELETNGILFEKNDGWSAHFPEFYQTTFHTADYVFRHWGRFFDIVALLPQGALNFQDLVVMRRFDGPPRPERKNLIKQEVVRVKSEVHQIKLQLDDLQQASKELSIMRGSRSWRVTAPLRLIRSWFHL